jgi:hypothetical protein
MGTNSFKKGALVGGCALARTTTKRWQFVYFMADPRA